MNQHEKTKRILKILGFIIAGLGLIFTIIGFVNFFSVFNSGEGMPDLFWCAMMGLPMLGIGISLLGVGFKREISHYMEKESAPVVNEAAKDMSPAVKTVASAVKEGISGSGKIYCTCGVENEKDSKFCKACGKALVKICPACGEVVDFDSAFCDHCGSKL